MTNKSEKTSYSHIHRARSQKHYDAILAEWKAKGTYAPRTRMITEVMHRMQKESHSKLPSRATVANWLKDYRTRDYYALCAALATERERLLQADSAAELQQPKQKVPPE